MKAVAETIRDENPPLNSKHWTFRSRAVAKHFTNTSGRSYPGMTLHQRGAHFGDTTSRVTASCTTSVLPTGNIGLALRETLIQRQAPVLRHRGERGKWRIGMRPAQLVVARRRLVRYAPFDFAVCFLCFMFLPAGQAGLIPAPVAGPDQARGAARNRGQGSDAGGYVGTAFSRLTLQQKLAVGAKTR